MTTLHISLYNGTKKVRSYVKKIQSLQHEFNYYSVLYKSGYRLDCEDDYPEYYDIADMINDEFNKWGGANLVRGTWTMNIVPDYCMP